MCLPGQSATATGAAPAPATATEAAAMAEAGLGWLAGSDPAALTAAERAGCLRSMERAGSMKTAARASFLSAFRAAGDCRGDGHRSARTWLAWQTRITGGAVSGAMGWMRRLCAHPLVRGALAGGEISASWARKICDWTGKLPAEARDDADPILLHAARGGADLDDLGGLAEEILRHTARPDTDGDGDGFGDRSLTLDTTFGGAGKLHGDLTPSCAAALSAGAGVARQEGRARRTPGCPGSASTTPSRKPAAA